MASLSTTFEPQFEAQEDAINKLAKAQLDVQQSQHEDMSSLQRVQLKMTQKQLDMENTQIDMQASIARLAERVEQNQAQLLDNQAKLIDALNQLASSRRERPQRLRSAQSSSTLLAQPQVSAFVVEDEHQI